MKLLLIAVACFFSLPVFAQGDPDSSYFARMPVKKVTLTNKLPGADISIPYKDILVWDARPDTSSIGFIAFHNPEKPDKILYQKNLTEEFSDFVKSNYKLNHADSAKTALVLFKRFRISDYASIEVVKNNNSIDWSSGIILSAELFIITGDSYHALYKIDTTVVAESESESIGDLTQNAFRTILKRSENKELSQMHIGKTGFSYADITKHVDDFSDVPVLKDKILRKGVYQNFTEFKMNTPSMSDFEIRKGKLSDELFVTENNQSYPLQDFWGYCDGHNLFLQSENNLFKLLRTGNTFNTKAIKSLSKTYEKTAMSNAAATYLLGVFSGLLKNKYVAKPAAFQLDMETGEIY